MFLDQDRFVVSFNQSLANERDITDIVEEAGFNVQVVTETITADQTKSDPPVDYPPFFVDILADAKRDKKPIVLDFTAVWCHPCQRMEQETFADPVVVSLLEQCVFLRLDTDEHISLTHRFGVTGLPDVRLLDSSGTEKVRLLGFQNPTSLQIELERLLRKSSHPGNELPSKLSGK